MASPSAEQPEPQIPSFRPGKKRKIYRHRAEDTDPPLDASLSPSQLPAPSDPRPSDPVSDTAEEHTSVSAVLRIRNARKHRLGGVAFRTGSARADEHNPENSEQNLVPHDGSAAENPVVGGIAKRFAPQTGLVGELVNKHMEEYIESELAKRHAAEARAAAAAAAAANGDHDQRAETSNTTAEVELGKPVVAQPAMHGKLLEIDLGDEARARNVAMTERARRKALGEEVGEDEDGNARSRKVRLGKDRKPWRGRGRRNSEDVKRDQLVEEFLRENRLDVYDMPPEQLAAAGSGAGDDVGADDKIAEEFRREFMDAMMQRQRRKPAAAAKPVPGKGAKAAEEVLKGPKLGGSRNSRAAMRDILLREQEKKR